MTSKTLVDILTQHGDSARDGDEIRIGDSVEVNLFAALGGENLIVARVVSATVSDDIINATTYRGERYVLACEDVRAVRFSPRDKKTGY